MYLKRNYSFLWPVTNNLKLQEEVVILKKQFVMILYGISPGKGKRDPFLATDWFTAKKHKKI